MPIPKGPGPAPGERRSPHQLLLPKCRSISPSYSAPFFVLIGLRHVHCGDRVDNRERYFTAEGAESAERKRLFQDAIQDLAVLSFHFLPGLIFSALSAPSAVNDFHFFLD